MLNPGTENLVKYPPEYEVTIWSVAKWLYAHAGIPSLIRNSTHFIAQMWQLINNGKSLPQHKQKATPRKPYLCCLTCITTLQLSGFLIISRLYILNLDDQDRLILKTQVQEMFVMTEDIPPLICICIPTCFLSLVSLTCLSLAICFSRTLVLSMTNTSTLSSLANLCLFTPMITSI